MSDMSKYEIVKFVDDCFELDVNVSPNEDTVWLNQEQLSKLFNVNIPAINKHINNILCEGELDLSTISFLEKVQIEGSRLIKRKIKIYNLDMIISVGYRVNSKRGITFRKWATSVLKSYLKRGFVIDDNKCINCMDSLLSINNRLNEIEKENRIIKNELFGNLYTRIKKGDVPKGVIMLDRIFNLAKNKITIIDNYIDEEIIHFIEKYDKNIEIITGNSKINGLSFDDKVKIKIDGSNHSRYIFVDDNYSYVLTYSLNSIGKKDFDVIYLDGIKPKTLLK